MKKIFILAALLMSAWLESFPQNTDRHMDSLKHLLSISKDDTSRIRRMAEICHDYGYADYDSALVYGQKALELSVQNKYPRGKARALFGLGCTYLVHGDISKAMESYLNGLQVAEENRFEPEKASCLMGIGFCYSVLTDYDKAITFFKEASEINKNIFLPEGLAFSKIENEVNLGTTFTDKKQLDSALIQLQKTFTEAPNSTWRAVTLQSLGDVYRLMGKQQSALACLHEALDINLKNNDRYSIVWCDNSLSILFKELKQTDSCIFYAKKALAVAKQINMKMGILTASQLLSGQYENTDYKEALNYRKIYDTVNTELYGTAKVVALQKTLLDEQERQRKIETERAAYQNKMKQYAFLAGLTILILIAFLLFRNNQKEKKAKNLLQQKNILVEQTLTDLKAAQSQLIQSEKMASLGELTAGIAHEIQNPLNFVNNFSEVSNELIDEMNDEIEKGDIEEAKAIANDIKQNLEKILHHGKRADGIVKGMLQHSRSSSATKEPTDINKLADEYLRLAYHGLRAKDKSFNATLETDFDEGIGKINIIPQDMGRVMLNLIINAFYEVDKKKKSPLENYEPAVSVSTKKINGKVEIKVTDNGNGIPQKVLDKIFQPFFTTKPTGQGTGLGLSLSYDIVKAHGGEIKVETKQDEGTEFIIQLPVV